MANIVIYGCGGHSKVVADIIKAEGTFSLACYYDDHPSQSTFEGLPVFSAEKEFRNFLSMKDVQHAVIAVGNNLARKTLFERALKLGLKLPALIHPTSILSPSCTIEDGTVVMPGAIVNSAAQIGKGVIVNTGAIVEHDCQVNSFAHIAPGSVLCGGVKVGELTMVGARTVVIPLMTIGARSTIGAGAVVVSNIGDDKCAYGTPARTMEMIK